MTGTVLELRGVGKQFGGLRALHKVDLAVSAHEVVGIMGANGAGKTTLFSLIAGHQTPSSGDILVDGKSILGLQPYEICWRGVGRTFQTVRPLAGLTVFDNVMIAARFGADYLRAVDARQRARTIIEAVGLTASANDQAESLTLSAQKKLEVARVVATGARIVLLDEVMAGLTPIEITAMLDVIKQLRGQYALTVLIIEHVMRALMHISDRILVLHHGESIALGAPGVIRSDQRVLDCYLGKDE
jgi:branched-chain amino acid transport system ATP-binding protein